MKKYSLLFSKSFDKDFKKLDHYTRVMLMNWIEKHLEGCNNPRQYGKALSANLKGLWRYRIGDYRLICEIQDSTLVILALAIGHRKDIYEKIQ